MHRESLSYSAVCFYLMDTLSRTPVGLPAGWSKRPQPRNSTRDHGRPNLAWSYYELCFFCTQNRRFYDIRLGCRRHQGLNAVCHKIRLQISLQILCRFANNATLLCRKHSDSLISCIGTFLFLPFVVSRLSCNAMLPHNTKGMTLFRKQTRQSNQIFIFPFIHG